MKPTEFIAEAINESYADLINYLNPFGKDKLILDVIIAHAKENIVFNKETTSSYKVLALISIRTSANKIRESGLFPSNILFSKIGEWCNDEIFKYKYRHDYARKISSMPMNNNTIRPHCGKDDMMINRNKEVSGKEKGNKILVILLGASVLFIMIPAILYLANEGRKNTIYHENISQLHEDSIREADSIAAVAYAAASAAASVTDESSDSDIAAENIYDEYEETKYDTGDIPYLAYFGRGKFDYNSLSKLTLTNNSSADAVLLLVRILNGEIIRNVFVHNRKNYVIKNIPEGKYMIRVMYGNSWYKQKDNGDQFPKGGFMKNVSFSQSKENNPFDYIFSRSEDGISYPTYSLTLHKVLNGNMRTEKISKDDFFK